MRVLKRVNESNKDSETLSLMKEIEKYKGLVKDWEYTALNGRTWGRLSYSYSDLEQAYSDLHRILRKAEDLNIDYSLRDEIGDMINSVEDLIGENDPHRFDDDYDYD
jgi:hypothetical protein